MARITRMTKRRLGELLQAEGLVTEEQVRAALEEQRKSNLFLGESLVKLGFVTEEVIAQTIVQQFNLPFASAMQFIVTPDILNIFPERMYFEYQFLAVDKIGKVLIIIGAGLMNHDVLDELERISGCKVHQYVSTWKDIRSALDKYAKDLKKEQSDLTSLGTMLLDISPTPGGGAPTLTPAAPAAPPAAAAPAKNGTATPGIAAAAATATTPSKTSTQALPVRPASTSGMQPKVPSPPTLRPTIAPSASGRMSALSGSGRLTAAPNVAPKTLNPTVAPTHANAPAPPPAGTVPNPTPVPAGQPGKTTESGRNPPVPKSGTGLLGLFKKPG